jgi:hypothetical protein
MFKLIIYKSALAVLMIVLSPILVHAQKSRANNSDSAVARLVQQKSFTFIAERANPMTGSSTIINSYYDVRVSADSVVATLPYFGRAYNVPFNSQGGINFTSTNFHYKFNYKKKSWRLTINFKDTEDVRQFSFTIFPNRSAILNVTSTNRQPISFNGRVKS